MFLYILESTNPTSDALPRRPVHAKPQRAWLSSCERHWHSCYCLSPCKTACSQTRNGNGAPFPGTPRGTAEAKQVKYQVEGRSPGEIDPLRLRSGLEGLHQSYTKVCPTIVPIAHFTPLTWQPGFDLSYHFQHLSFPFWGILSTRPLRGLLLLLASR